MSAPKNVDRTPAYLARERRTKIVKRVRFICILFAVLAIATVFALLPYRRMLPPLPIEAREAGTVRLHFLSVGQGDATVIESSGQCVVVDAGGGGFNETNHIIRYLRGLHVSAPVFLTTHAERDHYGGMATLIQTFGAKAVYLPALSSEDDGYLAISEAARAADAPVLTLTRGDEIAGGDVRIVCVSPAEETGTDKNAASCVLYLETERVRVLLGADIPAAREREIMQAAKDGEVGNSVELDEIDILRVSHHGSDSSSSEEWLEYLGAQVAVISCGAGNRYAHPAAGTVERLSSCVGDIYRTDELGDIMAVIGRDSFRMIAG